MGEIVYAYTVVDIPAFTIVPGISGCCKMAKRIGSHVSA